MKTWTRREEKPRQIRIQLVTGRWVPAFVYPGPCYDARACVCGFHKGTGQCEFGDCRGEVDPVGGNLCTDCASRPWRVALPGLHGPS
ncbi:hypothetical protein [Streptomyces sp. NPDC005244]|uniref:hypothetical protein n=1 Tax=Streptomyces sp. NPDC005244 TaxID=3364708 RepID=UPI00369F1B2B